MHDLNKSVHTKNYILTGFVIRIEKNYCELFNRNYAFIFNYEYS